MASMFLSHSFQSSNESADGLATAQDFAHLEEERGPTDNDRRHMAVISGIWNIGLLQRVEPLHGPARESLDDIVHRYSL